MYNTVNLKYQRSIYKRHLTALHIQGYVQNVRIQNFKLSICGSLTEMWGKKLCLSKQAMKTGRGSIGTASLIRNLGAPAVPPSREETSVPIQQEDGRASQPVWTFRRRK